MSIAAAADISCCISHIFKHKIFTQKVQP